MSIRAEHLSLVHGLDPYVVVFHQRMDLTTPLGCLRVILQTLGVSRDAPGYFPLWLGTLTFYLCIRILVLPFYWYNFVSLILPQMDEIKRCGYQLCLVLFFCQPCGHLLNVYSWSRGFMSLKRYLMNRKTNVI
ncbi:uncharacterized protein LOC144873556 [Branchiostoma floridae x Branchiostoma japonicum]